MSALTGIRPSLLARTDCTRSAVYQGFGTEEDPRPRNVDEYFFRGNVFEEIVVRQMAAKLGKDNILRQVVIQIPGLGEGHADAYLPDTRELVEIKSTTSPYPQHETFAAGVRQLQIYGCYHPEAERGKLIMIDPSRFAPADEYTVVWTADDRQRIAKQINEIEYALGASDDGVVIPDRVCRTPGDGRKRMCPYVNTCFDGYQEPFETLDDPETLSLVARLNEIKTDERIHRSALAILEEDRKTLQADLDDLVPAGKSQIGPYLVQRIDKPGRRTFSENAARAAGFPVEALAEFWKVGEGWAEYRVTRATETADVDFGEAPF